MGRCVGEWGEGITEGMGHACKYATPHRTHGWLASILRGD